MNNWLKAAVAATAVLALTGTAMASGATQRNAHPQPANAHPAQRRLDAPVDTSVESRYTPIAPCRIVDTRVRGGVIAAGATRSFHALGSGNFASQGGSSCDIPAAATAVTGSVISTGALGLGDLKVWGYGSPEPAASFLNFAPSPTLSASGTIPVAHSAYNFTVKADGHATQVVIQLTGYFIAPMWALIGADASIVGGSRVTSASQPSKPGYQVDFDRNVSECAYSVTTFYYGQTALAQPRIGDVNAVFVYASDYNGSPANTSFYLTVTC